jgi:ParB/RepB/Spo0J family partition protein
MYKDVPLTDVVDNPFQPRSVFDHTAIQSLADEIKAEGFWNGTLQGRRNARGQVELVFGHRRLRALRLLDMPSARIEILDLSDAQMALRALEENLQREGLTDFEKADAVRQAVDLERKRRTDAQEPERGTMETVAKRLGLAPGWVTTLCKISLSIEKDERASVDGWITAKTTLLAKGWGGKRYVKTLVRQAKAAAKPQAKISKPTENSVAAMKRAVAAAPEDIRPKLEDKIFDGDLVSSAEVEQSARSMKAAQVRRRSETPPDLKVVIHGWTEDLKEWNEKLTTVLPYIDYINEVPQVGERFRAALGKFIETASRVLAASR